MAVLEEKSVVRYKAVLFDWGGVLSVGGTPDELSERVALLLNKTQQETKALLSPLLDSLKRGKMTVEEYWRALEMELSREIATTDRDIWAPIASLRPQEELAAFTKELQSYGYVTGILSNVFPNTAADIRAAGWYDLYDPVLLSCDLGMAKPDREIYEHAVGRLGLPAEAIIFVDDQERCLEPARQLGMTTILARDAQQIIADISELIR